MACKRRGGGSSHDLDGIPYNVGMENFGSVSMGGDLRRYLKSLQDRIAELENNND